MRALLDHSPVTRCSTLLTQHEDLVLFNILMSVSPINDLCDRLLFTHSINYVQYDLLPKKEILPSKATSIALDIPLSVNWKRSSVRDRSLLDLPILLTEWRASSPRSNTFIRALHGDHVGSYYACRCA